MLKYLYSGPIKHKFLHCKLYMNTIFWRWQCTACMAVYSAWLSESTGVSILLLGKHLGFYNLNPDLILSSLPNYRIHISPYHLIMLCPFLCYLFVTALLSHAYIC